jgi:type VI secretion system FHA domain protein
MGTFKLAVSVLGNEQAVLSEHVCTKESLALGRAPGNDIVLPDVEKRVSSRHARIERRLDSFQIVDLGSTNGTFLNDRRLEAKSETEIKSGDRIAIGCYLLRFSTQEDEVLDQTIVSVDPARKSGELADLLPTLYARNSAQAPEVRQKVLKDALRSAISGSGSEVARSILVQLQSRFQAGEGASGPLRPTELRQRDARIEQQEGLYQAGWKATSQLSQRFLGTGEFEKTDQVELFAKLVTQALELTFEWISKSLKGRAEFESQFSADLTMIFAQQKNPLKSGGTAEDTAKFLLDWRSPRSVQSVRETLGSAFQDLTMHQLGLLAGVQESLSAVLRRLDPKVVEGEARGKPGGVFASLDKRAWKRYSEIFQEIFSENSKLFNEMIYPNVRKGYLALHSNSDPKADRVSALKEPAPKKEESQK